MALRQWIIGGGVAVGVTAAVMSAGTASAAQTRIETVDGYVAVSLDPNETAFLANTPVPDWIDQVSTPEHQFVDPAAYSTSPNIVTGDGKWYSGYTFAQLWREAAAHPGGSVTVYLTDPARFDGFLVQMRQY